MELSSCRVDIDDPTDKNSLTKLVEVFNREGLVIIPGLIRAPKIKRIFSAIESVFDQAMRGQNISLSKFSTIDEKYNFLKMNHPRLKSHCYDLIGHLDELREQATDSVVLNFVKSILGGNVLLDFTQVRIDDSQNDRLLPFHQEIYGQISKLCLTCWAPLRDVTIEGGAMRVVPGSHLRGLIPHKFYPELNNYHGVAEEVKPGEASYLTAKAGDAVIFHPLMLHGSSPNQRPDVRWTFITRYNSLSNVPYLENENASLRIPQD